MIKNEVFRMSKFSRRLDPASFPFHGVSWKEICCTLFFPTKLKLVSYMVQASANTTKPSKATSSVVCFLCAKAQKEQKMNSEC